MARPILGRHLCTQTAPVRVVAPESSGTVRARAVDGPLDGRADVVIQQHLHIKAELYSKKLADQAGCTREEKAAILGKKLGAHGPSCRALQRSQFCLSGQERGSPANLPRRFIPQNTNKNKIAK